MTDSVSAQSRARTEAAASAAFRQAGGVWPSPIADGVYVGPDGSKWRCRGAQVDRRRLRRLGRDGAVVILHGYGGGLREVIGEERLSLWARAEPYLFEREDDAALDDHTSFVAAEFKDSRRSMLVLEESC